MVTRTILKWQIVILAILLTAIRTAAQVVVPTPVFPIDVDSCSIIFDAAQGDAGLKGVAPPIYAHTGVITNLSTSSTDWKYVIANWNQNLPKAQLTALGNNKYKMSFKPSIRAFYGVPSNEQILKMAFVFRNADGSKTGRNADGSDVLVDVYPNVMSVNIVLPASRSLFLKQNDPIAISAISPTATSLKIFVNGTLAKTTSGQTITDTINANNFGQNWVKRWVRVEAHNATGSVADSFSYTVITSPTVAELPTGTDDGINYISPTSVVLSLFAPGKDHVFVTGDFNDWQLDYAHYMNKTPDGKRFWIQLDQLVPTMEYIFQYDVDGTIRIGDPYADKVSDPDDQYISPATYPDLLPYPSGKAKGIATYLETGQTPYYWSHPNFTPPAATDLVIYELLIRDFIAAHDYPTLADTISYFKKLGVNAIELMPVMEFEGNSSWGYNVNYPFAVDKYYGTKNGLKFFIDSCHAAGIAVILDIVCNHQFGSSPLAKLYWDATNQRPAANNPWFNAIPTHPYNVGNDFNHESPDTKAYMERLMKYWLTEYHIDGYRFEMSKGFTQKNSYPNNVSLWGNYDASRISILKNYEPVIHAVNSKAYMILEHFADNSEETVLVANKMMTWGNLEYQYIQSGGGWVSGSNSDLSWGSYKSRGWTVPSLVTYMESHDEERIMYKNISAGNVSKPPYNIKDTTTALKRVELNANFFYTIPGPKMIYEFEELGFDFSITYGGDRLTQKPIRWDYQNQWRRSYTRNVFSALADLKKTQPVFSTTDYTTDLTGAIKRIWLKSSSMNATVLGNFDVVEQNVTPNFTNTGKWYEFYTGDSLDVTNTSATLKFKPGEYRIYTTVRLKKPVFTAIDELDFKAMAGDRRVLIFPNPSDGTFRVTFDLSSRMEQMQLSVLSMQGKLVATMQLKNLPQGLNEIPVNLEKYLNSGTLNGIYLVRLTGSNFSESAKVIVR